MDVRRLKMKLHNKVRTAVPPREGPISASMCFNSHRARPKQRRNQQHGLFASFFYNVSKSCYVIIQVSYEISPCREQSHASPEQLLYVNVVHQSR